MWSDHLGPPHRIGIFDYKKNKVTNAIQGTRKKKMRTAAIAVRFSTSLFRARWLQRPKIAVLFASQSGKAEKFATTVFSKLNSLFQVQVSFL